MGREDVEHALVIVVEPGDFFIQEHLFDNRRGVDGTEGETLKLQELAKLGLLVGGYQQGVFDTHTKLTFEIDARLVGDGHASHQRGGLPLHTELMRTLVQIQIGTHTMTCAMQIVQSLAPHRFSGQNIYLGTTGSTGELT